MSAVIRTRFPPEPNGPLHIGHLKAIVANFMGLSHTESTAPGSRSTVLRFDNTNPETETKEYEDAIIADLAWLGFKPSGITRTSDYFDILDSFCEKLLASGEAYIEKGSSDVISAQRLLGTPSIFRDGPLVIAPPDSIGGLNPIGGLMPGTCIRLKIDPAHKNTCMRDPVIYRYKEHPGYRCPTRRVYPSYDFSHSIVDYLEKITHSYCSREFYVRRELYYYILERYRAVMEGNSSKMADMADISDSLPAVYEFNRLEIEDVKLSKRYFLEMLSSGECSSFSDKKLFTIAGLRNCGHDPKALIHFIQNYVSYNLGEGGVIPKHKFEHALREYYEANAPRRFGVPCDKLLRVKILPGDARGLSQARLPDGLEGGSIRVVSIEAGGAGGAGGAGREGYMVFINSDDFRMEANKKYKRLKPGKRVWLKNYCQVEYVCYIPGLLTVRAVEPDGKYHCAIQWLSASETREVPCDTFHRWSIERDMPVNTVVQFERCGYVRLDQTLKYIMDLKSTYVE